MKCRILRIYEKNVNKEKQRNKKRLNIGLYEHMNQDETEQHKYLVKVKKS